MFRDVFLAHTCRETNLQMSPRFAYMAVHFSPYSKGLSNIPANLPPDNILLLDDSMPPADHDPSMVTAQLTKLIHQFSPKAIVLDFQRPVTEQLKAMSSHILQTLPCPVAATEAYAKDFKCPVLLSPTPPNRALADYIAPWKSQGVYLEIAPEATQITVTECGSTVTQIPLVKDLPLEDNRIHCHYNVEVFTDKAIFTICRDKDDLANLVEEAKELGVMGCVGFYKELYE